MLQSQAGVLLPQNRLVDLISAGEAGAVESLTDPFDADKMLRRSISGMTQFTDASNGSQVW